MSRLTLKAAQKQLAEVGISLRKIEGEYRVARRGTRLDDTYSEAYYTDSLQDALQTGMLMAVPTTALKQAAVLAQAVKQSAPAPASDVIVTLLQAAVAEVKAGNGASVKAHGKTFRVSPNAYGNWYGYIGTRKVRWFFGDFIDQSFDAAEWLVMQVEGK